MWQESWRWTNWSFMGGTWPRPLTRQYPVYDGPGLDAVYALVTDFRSRGFEGIFGPEVAVPSDAPLFDRILGVTGRDPDWQPPTG